MVPNPFFAKVIVKVVSIVAKSAIKAYSNTLKKNNAVNGKKAFKFDWNDIFKYNKFNMLNKLDLSKLKSYNPFEKSEQEPGAGPDTQSKDNSHKISQSEATKILAIEADTKLSLQLIMEQYLFLYTKNKPESGGSAYLQAKILNAKDMLIEEFGGTKEEIKWREAHGYMDDDNTVFERGSAGKNTEAASEDAPGIELESAGEEKSSQTEEKVLSEEEEMKKQKEQEEQKQKEEEESDSDLEDEKAKAAAKKEEAGEAKGEEDADLKEKDASENDKHKENIEGEFQKYTEEGPADEEDEKEGHDQDGEIEKLVKKIEAKSEGKKENKKKK